MIKILIVAGAMNVGGLENQLMHLLRKADKSKFQIDFTNTDEKAYFESEIESLGGRCHLIHSTDGGRHLIQYCRDLYKVIKSGRYDIVHSQELFHSGIVLRVAKVAGVNVRIAHAHNWAEGSTIGEKRTLIRRLYTQIMRRWLVQDGTDFCACSSLAGEYVFGEKVIHQDNYHVIYNSIDISKYLDQYNKIETGEFMDYGWKNVVQVGRFSDVKNQMFTVRIAEELKNRGKKIRILCAGDYNTPYGEEADKAIREKGLEDYIQLIGIRKDIDVLLRKSSAFLLPSQYEGMPLVLIEAQAAGLPCVVADTFSHEVDFNIGKIDWLPINESVENWTDAVEKAVNQDRADKYSVIAAIEKYGFSSDRFAQKMCEIYESAIKGNNNND